MDTQPVQISSYNDLLTRINTLKEDKNRQEEALKESLRSFANSLNPVTRLKASIHRLATDTDLYTDLVQAGLHAGVRYVIKKIRGNRHSENNAVASALLDNIIAWAINGNISEAIASIRNYFHHPKEEDEVTDEAEI